MLSKLWGRVTQQRNVRLKNLNHQEVAWNIENPLIAIFNFSHSSHIFSFSVTYSNLLLPMPFCIRFMVSKFYILTNQWKHHLSQQSHSIMQSFTLGGHINLSLSGQWPYHLHDLMKFVRKKATTSKTPIDFACWRKPFRMMFELW